LKLRESIAFCFCVVRLNWTAKKCTYLQGS
jgi:hypothetical protein